MVRFIAVLLTCYATTALSEPVVKIASKIPFNSRALATAIDPKNPKRLAVYNGKGSVELLNFETGQQEWLFDNNGSSAASYASVTFSGDSRRVAVTILGSRPFFNVVDSNTGKLTFQQPVLYPEKPSIIAWPPQTAFSNDHRLMLTETNVDGQFDLISTEEDNVVTQFEMSPSNQRRILRLGFSVDNKLIFASTSRELKIWSSHSFQLQKTIQYKNLPDEDRFYLLNDLSFTPDFRYVAFAFSDGSNNHHQTFIYDSQTESILDSFPTKGVSRLAFNLSGRILTVVSGSGWLYQYELSKKKIVTENKFLNVDRKDFFYLDNLAFSQDCDYMLTDFDENGNVGHLVMWSITKP